MSRDNDSPAETTRKMRGQLRCLLALLERLERGEGAPDGSFRPYIRATRDALGIEDAPSQAEGRR